MSAAKFQIKVYDSTGTVYRRTIPAESVLNLPRIIREVGKPASPVSIRIASQWDSFGYGDTINLFDLVKIYAVDPNHKAGTLIFQGHITGTTLTSDGSRNSVELILFPIDNLLGMALFKTTGGAYTVSYSGSDVDAIITDVITRANGIHGAFFSGDLANPGESLTVDFDEKTHLQVIQEAVAFLDDSYFWRVEPDGTIKLAIYNDSTADHILTFEKDISAIEIQNNIAEVKNGLRLAWGGGPTYSYYEDATSKSDYGTREETQSEPGIGAAGTADTLGASEIAKKKDPKATTRLVANMTYDLVSVLPGDTIRIRNLPTAVADILGDTLRIKRVEFDGINAQIYTDDTVPNFGHELSKALA